MGFHVYWHINFSKALPAPSFTLETECSNALRYFGHIPEDSNLIYTVYLQRMHKIQE